MVSRCCAFLVLTVVAAAGLAVASERPVAVSPGSETGSLVESRCPTFSWGAVPGAKSYELVVYSVREETEEAKPVLTQRISGSALGWTPSLDRCLERGGQYAWSLRAVGEKEVSAWSPPHLFHVAAAEVEVKLEEAIVVLRRYLAAKNAWAPTTAETPGLVIPPPETDRQARATSLSTATPAETALSVDGNVDATSFTGDGSTLSGVNEDTHLLAAETARAVLVCPGLETLADRFSNCGNGTVRDNATGLLWLENANCLGAMTTFNAAGFASVLADGQCGLTDGSVAGQWRLPKVGNFCSSWLGADLTCPRLASPDSLLNTAFSSPALSNARGDGPWSPGDPWLGPVSSNYWSVAVGGFYWFVDVLDGDVAQAGGLNPTAFAWPVRNE